MHFGRSEEMQLIQRKRSGTSSHACRSICGSRGACLEEEGRSNPRQWQRYQSVREWSKPMDQITRSARISWWRMPRWWQDMMAVPRSTIDTNLQQLAAMLADPFPIVYSIRPESDRQPGQLRYLLVEMTFLDDVYKWETALTSKDETVCESVEPKSKQFAMYDQRLVALWGYKSKWPEVKQNWIDWIEKWMRAGRFEN